ncbi:MAG: EF-hand domain-containing protein [Pseudomonadota bacterium]
MTFSHKTRFALLFASALSVAGTAAVADGHRGARSGLDARAQIELLDLNGDGTLTRAEIDEAQAARFAAADTDGDGVLSPAEIEARVLVEAELRSAQLAERMLARMDDNEDGVLSAEESQMPNIDRMFRFLDEDEDGVLSAEELARLDEPRRGWFGRRS